jgi:hypothetical protein
MQNEVEELPARKLDKLGRPASPGRPPALVMDEGTLKKIKNLAAGQCTKEDAAGFLGVSLPTFRAFLSANEKAQEAWDMGPSAGKASLRLIQFNLAKKSTAMAIWLGKQWLGQKDNLQLGPMDIPQPSIGERNAEDGQTPLLAAALQAVRKVKSGS